MFGLDSPERDNFIYSTPRERQIEEGTVELYSERIKNKPVKKDGIKEFTLAEKDSNF